DICKSGGGELHLLYLRHFQERQGRCHRCGDPLWLREELRRGGKGKNGTEVLSAAPLSSHLCVSVYLSSDVFWWHAVHWADGKVFHTGYGDDAAPYHFYCSQHAALYAGKGFLSPTAAGDPVWWQLSASGSRGTD